MKISASTDGNADEACLSFDKRRLPRAPQAASQPSAPSVHAPGTELTEIPAPSSCRPCGSSGRIGGAQPGVSFPGAVDSQRTSVGPAELPALAQILRDKRVAQPLSPGPRDSPCALACFPGYQISWEVYGKSDSRMERTLNSSTHEYKIQGLSSLTTYTIDVAALTAVGAGLATSSTISSGVPPGQCARGLASPLPRFPGPFLTLGVDGHLLCRSPWGPLKEGCQLLARMAGGQ